MRFWMMIAVYLLRWPEFPTNIDGAVAFILIVGIVSGLTFDILELTKG